MKVAYDNGINFFDTAEAYAKGESEIVMGEAIKKYGWKRSDLVISTKASFHHSFMSLDPGAVKIASFVQCSCLPAKST